MYLMKHMPTLIFMAGTPFKTWDGNTGLKRKPKIFSTAQILHKAKAEKHLTFKLQELLFYLVTFTKCCNKERECCSVEKLTLKQLLRRILFAVNFETCTKCKTGLTVNVGCVFFAF